MRSLGPPGKSGRSRARARARAGTSLAELVVALALFGVVGAALLRAFDRQARFHTGIVRLVETHAQLTVTHDAVAAELRSLASPRDILRLSDTAVAYRAFSGSAVACAVSGAMVTLAPEVLAGGVVLARLRTSPQPGDSAWLFDEGPTLSRGDDTWQGAAVLSAQVVPGGCDGSAFVHPVADAGRPAWRLVLDTVPAMSSGITPGALVHVTRLARFALYRSASGETNLGWSDWNAAAGAWNVIQPVTGPFLPYRAALPGASGVALAAFDSAGVGTGIGPAFAPPALVHLMTRAVTSRAIRLDGMPRGPHSDSLRSAIAPRNRP